MLDFTIYKDMFGGWHIGTGWIIVFVILAIALVAGGVKGKIRRDRRKRSRKD